MEKGASGVSAAPEVMELLKDLPEELEPFREELLRSRRPYYKIVPQESRETLPWESKIGGESYQPQGSAYPSAPDGSPLALLIQADFGQAPLLPPFPSSGLLQVFVHDDDMYGLNIEDPFDQGHFRIRYFPELIPSEHSPSYFAREALANTYSLPFNPNLSFPVSLEVAEEAVPPQDLHFSQQLGEGFFEQFGGRQWELLNDYKQAVKSYPHKMGGYAFFPQADPRDTKAPMELLLQINSDERIQCMWGDMGVAHFFISKAMLEKRDFSQVMYHWDCY